MTFALGLKPTICEAKAVSHQAVILILNCEKPLHSRVALFINILSRKKGKREELKTQISAKRIIFVKEGLSDTGVLRERSMLLVSFFIDYFTSLCPHAHTHSQNDWLLKA